MPGVSCCLALLSLLLTNLCAGMDKSSGDGRRAGHAAIDMPSPPLLAPPTTAHLPEPGTPLNLKLKRTVSPFDLAPSTGLSPVFRGYVQSPLNTATAAPASGLDDEGRRPLAQIIGISATSSLSSLCIVRGNDSPGACIRWSSNDGLGFYVQGRPFMQLKRLMDSKNANICPPGDTSAMCRELPRRMCE